MRVPKQYTEEFKSDALNLVRRGDRSIAEVARDLGVSHWTLRGWVKSEQMAKRTKKGPGKSVAADPATESPQQRLERLERENERLRKENDSLRTDRAILKKAAAFFAKESE
jgi:transposase